ncbi:hypothetical protein [Kitasatospora sp. NPDC097691]|uniref:hypothetical protein n=1 Tax=Kitasatospora sp. NPDC097691 TaxID=3157231 RepID=UPI003333FA3F
MEVFTCEGCGTALTTPLSRVAFPLYAGHIYGNGHPMPVLMDAGTYAADRGPTGAPGPVVIAPGDAVGTVLIPERNAGFCCGLDGGEGPNLACAGCGREVATRVDDCSLWQATWLERAAVRPVALGPARPVAGWAQLGEQRRGTALLDLAGEWDPRWESEVSVTLAHLVAAADGSPVTVADGPLADAFRRFLAALPHGRPAKRAVLAGPGLPLPEPLPDIAVVPRHPQTGEPWPTPPGVAAAPLAIGFWRRLAFHEEHPTRPTAGGLPPGVERDDPLPPHPRRPVLPIDHTFLRALERLPDIRPAWLSFVRDNARALLDP